MNEYLLEMENELDNKETDIEEMMYIMCNRKFHNNKKNREKKGNYTYGKKCNCSIYC